MKFRRSGASLILLVLIAAGSYLALGKLGRHGSPVSRVEFNRDIRPILNRSCVSCHGGVRQKGGVSFIYRDEALGKGQSGRPTIIPGHPDRSELIARLTTTDPEARMPYHAPALPAGQIALLRRWIKEGAQWEDYWAFVPPKPQRVPDVRDRQWPRQPEDRFILSRLEKEGLRPSQEATRAQLLRRVSFDLTGLPPSPDELAAFLADTSANAYEKQVERLLASPAYGERWAALWLDLARYADSRGYTQDPDRPMWPYRDWVINAFNANMPYDRFVITQLAGDLFPNATLEDQIATAFHRMTPLNDEAGTDDEEFRLATVMDRVATTWAVLNGLTINCVQCHSHPYDPIRHVEYYKFLAFFNVSRDADLTDDSPVIPIPRDAARRGEVLDMLRRSSRIAQDLVQQGRSLAEKTRWMVLPIQSAVSNERLGLQRLIAHLEAGRATGINARAHFGELPPAKIRAFYDDAIAKARSNLDQLDASAGSTELKIENGEAVTLGAERTISAQEVYDLSTGPSASPVTALRIEVPPSDPAKAMHTPEDGFIINNVDAWIVAPTGEQQRLEFQYFVPDSQESLMLELKSGVGARDSHRVRVATLGDDAGLVGLGEFTANTKLFRTRWTIAVPKTPAQIPPGGHIRVQLTQLQTQSSKPAVARRVRLSVTADESWTRVVTDPVFTTQLTELSELQDRLDDIPSVRLPVMADQAPFERRLTMEFERGDFLKKVGPVLTPNVPRAFPQLPRSAPRDRLTMARWFFAPGQPLTARVAVNRLWEQLFGTGLVETLEDFGSAGLPPSHPELLDWLALHFQNDLRWNVKALLRELVESSTYRQSAKLPGPSGQDPRNRLLAHGPQQRLTAEMVRDQALLASGLLNDTMGGPPVMPPQPAGLWINAATGKGWRDAYGPDRYRRAIYTFEKRAAPYPSFVIFDGPDHVVSSPRRIPTNTPLQALVTLNDPVYQDAAEALAKRMLAIKLPGGHLDNTKSRLIDHELLDRRLDFLARCVLSRDLSAQERQELEALYADVTKTASSSSTALTALASVVLNLDAALIR